MAIGYLSQEDAYRRLNGTVCFIKNEPVYVTVHRNFPTNTVHWTLFSEFIKRMRGDSDKTIMITDDEFSVTCPRLGYVNMDTTVGYVCRSAMRTSVQGLSSKTVKVMLNNNVQGFNKESVFFSDSFISMLKNEYPKFDDAFGSVMERERKSCAFSKDYAVQRIDTHNVGVYFKNNRLVAFYNPIEKVFNTMPVCMGLDLFIKDLSKHGVEIRKP